MTKFRVHVEYGDIKDSVDVEADSATQASITAVKEIKASFLGKVPSVVVKKVKVVR